MSENQLVAEKVRKQKNGANKGRISLEKRNSPFLK